jgi:Enoyl-CoA hydratase/isomerase
MSLQEAQEFVMQLRSTFSTIQALSMPTIALVQGLALGGGAELALACDFRVCSTLCRKHAALLLPMVALFHATHAAPHQTGGWAAQHGQVPQLIHVTSDSVHCYLLYRWQRPFFLAGNQARNHPRCRRHSAAAEVSLP